MQFKLDKITLNRLIVGLFKKYIQSIKLMEIYLAFDTQSEYTPNTFLMNNKSQCELRERERESTVDNDISVTAY